MTDLKKETSTASTHGFGNVIHIRRKEGALDPVENKIEEFKKVRQNKGLILEGETVRTILNGRSQVTADWAMFDFVYALNPFTADMTYMDYGMQMYGILWEHWNRTLESYETLTDAFDSVIRENDLIVQRNALDILEMRIHREWMKERTLCLQKDFQKFKKKRLKENEKELERIRKEHKEAEEKARQEHIEKELEK